MNLNDEEQDILAGKCGPVARLALQHQLKVGEFFGAEDFVPVTQAHIMADTESLGEEGVRWVESLAGASVRVPTIMDPRGTDFAKASVLKHSSKILDLERRCIEAFKRLGIFMTDTCINYQTIQAPAPGESVAFGDTGVVIYCNSVCGARSNFEGGPSAVAAGLTGRTPRYGFHLDATRKATVRVRVEWTPVTLNDWGALGGLIGRLAGNYWAVPHVEGLSAVPGSDQLKHFGAAMASFGSVALYHLVGVTPEAPTFEAAVGPNRTLETFTYGKAEQRRTYETLNARGQDTNVDYVMLGCPHAALEQIQEICRLLEGRRINSGVRLWVFTSRAIRAVADKEGYSKIIRDAGGVLITDTCSAIGQALPPNTKVAALDSAKQVHYLPAIMGIQAWFGTTADCIDAALTGRWRGVAP